MSACDTSKVVEIDTATWCEQPLLYPDVDCPHWLWAGLCDDGETGA